MAAEMLVRCVFDGSISMQDFLIERRPYHRNCGCALHDEMKNNGACPHGLKNTSVSFLKKQKWTKSFLHIEADEDALFVNIPRSKSSLNLLIDQISACVENHC